MAVQAVTFSNKSYENDIVSAFEMAKGYNKPVNCNDGSKVPDDIVDAQERLSAKCKLELTFKSMATFEEHVKGSDMIELYQKIRMNNREIRFTLKILLTLNHNAHFVIAPGKAGKRITMAVKDVRRPIEEQSFEHAVKSAIDYR